MGHKRIRGRRLVICLCKNEMNKNRTRAPEKRLLRIKSSSILEVLPESRSGSPQSGILASGSSVRTAPSHSNSCNGCKGFLNLCLLGHPRLQWRDRCGFAPHSSVPWSISIIRDRTPGVKRRSAILFLAQYGDIGSIFLKRQNWI